VDDLAQQKLYEKWLKEDRWLLRSQALPLLAGFDPEGTELPLPDDLWDKMAEAVSNAELAVENAGATPEHWAASPRAVYRWATGNGIAVPEPFRTLMEFILQTVRIEEPSRDRDLGETGFHTDNEKILAAALSVLGAYPGQCLGRNGSIDIRKVIVLMHDHAGELFGTDGLEYSYERVHDLLRGRIKKLVKSEE
jgi:hypothetical protein